MSHVTDRSGLTAWERAADDVDRAERALHCTLTTVTKPSG